MSVESYVPAEVLAEGRSIVVEHLVQEAFADMPQDRREAYGQLVLQQFMRSVMPGVNAASCEARAAGTSDKADEKRMQATMEALCAVMEDALRECGLDINIVPVQAKGPRRG